MPETLEKLRPDRDLQCYFRRPSSIAALSQTSAGGYTVSGCWREQFDWAVIEWNRDNVFEHPVLRSLPDGDLSGLQLSYEESRAGCIPIDSSLYPTVDWPYLRVWATANGVEQLYRVSLLGHATPIAGSYSAAWAEFTLSGTVTGGDYIGLAWLTEHYTYQLYGSDTLETAVAAIVASVNAFSPVMKAAASGATIRVSYVGAGGTLESNTAGANGNRIGVYSYTSGSGTTTWSAPWQVLEGGTSPTTWRIDLDFSSLEDTNGVPIPTQSVRKMRWTYAADLRAGSYQRQEFQAQVANWQVTGTNRSYQVAGRSSIRLEDDSAAVTYSGSWNKGQGNFSGGSIHFASTPGCAAEVNYEYPTQHQLFLGARYIDRGPNVTVKLDGTVVKTVALGIAGEDVLARIDLGGYGAGRHTVRVEHAGSAGEVLYFDFVEVACPSGYPPDLDSEAKLTLATDWDTDHSIALAPERTAWLMNKLGFRGRVNHYAGAMWFYELTQRGFAYASAMVAFSGQPQPNSIVTLRLGRVGQPSQNDTVIQHLVHYGDTAVTIAKAFELILNSGYTAVWAETTGAALRIWSRTSGADGNAVTISADPSTGSFSAVASGSTLEGGQDGSWLTDLEAIPRLNRAARDWTRSFLAALHEAGLTATCSFSMELQHGDPLLSTGIAQRYPDGSAVMLSTPALQTNFSPASVAYWREVHREMAGIMSDAGQAPYLQFGEVQWWYFPDNGTGMPYYDQYTTTQFQVEYGRALPLFANSSVDPAAYPAETGYLSQLVGTFTTQVTDYVRQTYPECRFEVLYPTDVNDTPLNQVVNYPRGTWTPETLDCLKTESFTYTLMRDLNAAVRSMEYSGTLGFPKEKRSHLVGISSASTAWAREARLAEGEVGDSVVLFALDQFCLIGYAVPVPGLQRRSAAYP